MLNYEEKNILFFIDDNNNTTSRIKLKFKFHLFLYIEVSNKHANIVIFHILYKIHYTIYNIFV